MTTAQLLISLVIACQTRCLFVYIVMFVKNKLCVICANWIIHDFQYLI